jgi:hypothetical protein
LYVAYKICAMGMLEDFMSKRAGCIAVSALLGIGLATMFHRACVGRDCVVMKGPDVNHITSHVWRNGHEGCYKYSVQKVDCPDQSKQKGDDVVAA